MFRRLTLPIAVLAMALAGCGEEEDFGAGESGSGSAGGERQSQDDGTTAADSQEVSCEQVEQPAPKPDGGATKPTEGLDPQKTYVVVLETNCGDIGIRLDHKLSPETTASFANLAKTGFFDKTTFHRIVPGFVIQGGDPTGTGTGGPGYSTRDVPPRGTAYLKGNVAMAKTATDPRGLAGSQFYIVTAPDAQLPADYALLGKVVRGQDVAEAIGRLGDPASGNMGTPLQPVVIERARLVVR